MPLADHEAQKEYMRRRYRERYASDPKFRLAEAKRKARHYSNDELYQRRAKQRAAIRHRRNYVPASERCPYYAALLKIARILKKLEGHSCKCPTPTCSVAGDMKHQAIELILQLSQREGFTPSELLADALDRCMKVHDSCQYEEETQHQRQSPIEGPRGQKPLVPQ